MSATRRETIRRAAVGSAGLAAAGLLPALARPAPAAAQETAEELRDFLVEAIAREQLAVLAYAGAAETAKDGQAARALELLRDQDQAHANALRSALDTLGYDPPEPPASVNDSGVMEDVEGLEDEVAAELRDDLAGLADLGEEESLVAAAALTARAASYYLEAAPELESEDLSRTAAEIVGSHAEHLVVVRGALGDTPLEILEGRGGLAERRGA